MARDPHPFYIPPESFRPDGSVRFPEEEARHLLRVIRLRAGDTCRVTDGMGGIYVVRLQGTLEALDGIRLEARHESRPAPEIELGFPLLHNRARMEWMLEKAVEVGADAQVPILWRRNVGEMTPAARRRWERMLREAMKQSERSWLPDLRDAEPPELPGGEARVILADPEGEAALPPMAGAAGAAGAARGSPVRLLIGPEGGASPEERERLRVAGAIFWSLGPTRLRAETAAIVGLHRLRQELRRGDGPGGGAGGVDDDQRERGTTDAVA
ncbi:MAG: RsmE family RNA methyltransferase [Candidatus Eisenbacteria bacterium]|nr:RsmE family RNA methyltransferase [Candidatus Eisenbacteria bacterium]